MRFGGLRLSALFLSSWWKLPDFVCYQIQEKKVGRQPTLYITPTARLSGPLFLILLLVIFYYGAVSYIEMRTLPKSIRLSILKVKSGPGK